MDFKSMIQFRLKSCFGNAMPAGACSGFLSSGVASLSSGVEANVSMRDRPLLKALRSHWLDSTDHPFEILQEACAVSESVGPSPARHGDAMFGPRRLRKFFEPTTAARGGKKNDRNLQVWIEDGLIADSVPVLRCFDTRQYVNVDR